MVMKRHRFYPIVFLLCFVTLMMTNCGPGEQVQPGGDSIVGSWDWIKTITAKPHYEFYADSVGPADGITFTQDGQVLYYHMGSFIQFYWDRYTLRYEPRDFLNPSGDSILVLNYHNASRSSSDVHVYIQHDTLILDQGYMDVATDYYKWRK